jgi:predicted PolB exonuclease-like 3'-5' exonuclease
MRAGRSSLDLADGQDGCGEIDLIPRSTNSAALRPWRKASRTMVASRCPCLPGKPSGIDGGEVEAMVNAGRIAQLSQYCESDVLNTYRLWLVYDLESILLA